MLQQEQRIDVPLDDEGLNEEKNERTTDVGYRTLDNFVFTEDGALKRRYGHTSVNTVVLIDNVGEFTNLSNQPNDVRGLTSYGNTALLFDKDFAYSVAMGPNGVNRLTRMGWMPQCSAFRVPVTALSQTITHFDSAWGKSTNGSDAGYHIVAYSAFGDESHRGVYATVIDAETGAYIFQDRLLYTPTGATNVTGPPKIAVDGHYVSVSFRSGTGVLNPLVSFTLDLDTMDWTVTPFSTFSIGPHDVIGGGTDNPRGYFHVIQQGGAGVFTTNIVVSRYHTANGVINGTVNVPMPGATADSMESVAADFMDSDNAVWLTYVGQSDNPAFARVDSGCTALLTAATIIAGTNGAESQIISIGCDQDSGNAVISYGDYTTVGTGGGGGTPVPMRYVAVDFNGTAIVPEKTLYDWFPRSRVVCRDGRFYQQVIHNSNTFQATSCLVDLMVDAAAEEALDEPRPVARYAPRLVAGGPSNWTGAPDSSVVFASEFLPIATNLYPVGDDVLCGGTQVTSLDGRGQIQRVEFDFGHGNGVGLGAELGDYVYLAGGQPTVIDKRRPYEQGFTLYPEPGTLTNATGGALNASANYGYRVCFVHYAANGDADISSPADFGYVTTNAANRLVNVTINSQYLTAKHDSNSVYLPDVYAQVYRTPNEQGTYYYVGKERVYPNTQNVTFTDNVPDATLISNPVLYTEGGFLDNVCAPSFIHLCAHKNRIFGIGDDRKTVWYSKRYVSGEVPGFNEQLTFGVDDDADPLLAICSLDDKLILFKEEKIYYVTGDGPSPGGAGGTLSDPTVLNNRIGCSNPRSLVVCPDGAFFQAPDTRIYLLTRGLDVVPIGKRVQQQTTAYPVCAASYADDTQQQVRFCMLDEEGGANGVELVFDYERKKWSRFTFNGTTGFVGATHVNGVNWKITSNGSLYYEDKTRFNDNNTAIAAVAARLWFKPAGPQGVARLTRVGLQYERESNDVGINVSLANNFNTAYHQSSVWTTTQLNTLGANNFNLQVVPTRQESAAFSVKINQVDTNVPNAGRGVTLTGLSFTFGIDRDQVRVQNGAQK